MYIKSISLFFSPHLFFSLITFTYNPFSRLPPLDPFLSRLLVSFSVNPSSTPASHLCLTTFLPESIIYPPDLSLSLPVTRSLVPTLFYNVSPFLLPWTVPPFPLFRVVCAIRLGLCHKKKRETVRLPAGLKGYGNEILWSHCLDESHKVGVCVCMQSVESALSLVMTGSWPGTPGSAVLNAGKSCLCLVGQKKNSLTNDDLTFL